MNIIGTGLKYLISFFSKVGLLRLSAFILFIYVFIKNGRRKGITVLCLTRRSNVFDVRALKKYEKRFNFIELPFNILKFAQPWLPNLDQTFYQDGLLEYPDAVYKSKLFAASFLKYLKYFGSYDLKFILSANFDYYEDFAFKSHSSIMYIGLSREHYLMPLSFQRGLSRYYNNYNFKGNRIFVYGEQTRKLLLQSKIGKKDEIIVTGCPRMDMISDLNYKNTSRNYITLFSFIDGLYDGNQTFFEILNIFLNLADKYPDQQFLIKCKSDYDYKILNDYCKNKPNIHLSYLMEFTKPFEVSKLIISFNSNSILESLLSRAAILIPYWGDTVKPQQELLVDPNEDEFLVFNFAHNQKDFTEFVENIITSKGIYKINETERMATFGKYYFLSDQRFSNVVGDEIQKLLDIS
ncbi:hypothetical protein LB465_11920 [Salegentibacter sp. LM13S]|uniref:hypothetical protein n=1 Tax=Salegentibacter lacus TaxID=2873599 RepID=UPI001CCE56E9|nr:hypothetical protein [Salegentibacter lacus]MBZ9631488.1 hypothetical protein [Salegentibacter lacus]